MREKNYFHANVRKCCVSTMEDGVPTGVEVITALEQSIDTDKPVKFIYPKPSVASYDTSSLTEAELELLFKETPVAHTLFGSISQAWAVNQLNEGSSDDD
jgi:hypothetical protein